MKDCYRTYDDLRAIIWDILSNAFDPDDNTVEYLSKWLVDNGYQLERYEIAGDDIKELQDNLTVRLERTEDEQAELDRLQSERLTGSLDLTNLIIPPAKKMDRCPEDILKEEVETGGE